MKESNRRIIPGAGIERSSRNNHYARPCEWSRFIYPHGSGSGHGVKTQFLFGGGGDCDGAKGPRQIHPMEIDGAALWQKP